jgi:acetate kinase
MGFTPLEGLVMGTRSGDVDPALVAYLGRKEGLSADQGERLLNEGSGLLGLSGLSSDMREALEVFCHRVRKYIGAYLAVLGGADAVILGGGIGERSAEIRARICAGMGWCGLQLDARRNEAAAGVAAGHAVNISDDQASLACYVAGVDEEIAIARATRDCVMNFLP